jgi:hypothetical protein
MPPYRRLRPWLLLPTTISSAFASYVVLGFGDQLLEVSQVFPANELIHDEHVHD